MFNITDEQYSKLMPWIQEQKNKAHGYAGAIGGTITYSFTPTNLGTVITAKHNLTEEVIDISDYENW